MRLKDLYSHYRDQVEFAVVYVREAHPSDKWALGRSRTQRIVHSLSGYPSRLDPPDPTTMSERRQLAASCSADLLEAVPLFVDTMDDEVSGKYAGKPTRIYLIGTDGRVVYNPGKGPFGYNPEHLGTEIEKYLARGSSNDDDPS